MGIKIGNLAKHNTYLNCVSDTHQSTNCMTRSLSLTQNDIKYSKGENNISPYRVNLN